MKETVMKRTIRNNIHAEYSLHDMCISEIKIKEDTVIMKTLSGIVKVAPPCSQPEGYVEFNGVELDFCYVYLIKFTGNVGTFSGEKMYLKDFTERYPAPYFDVIDQTYGYNSTKYSGFITKAGVLYECIIEIYHEGDMVFVTEE